MVDEYLEVNKHLRIVLEELHGTDSKWKDIGIFLEIEHSTLDKIGTEHKNSIADCNREMLTEWLRTGEATWKKLVEALKKKRVGLSKKAVSIEKKFITHDQSHKDESGNNTGLEDAGERSKNEYCQERLREILEWLLKMDFDLEDIQKWIEEKKEATSQPTPSSRRSSTNGKPSSSKKRSADRKRSNSRSSRRKQPKPKRSRSAESETSTGGNPLTTRLKSKRRHEKMVMILTELEKEKSAGEFIDPVDKEDVPDYCNIIKNPMCLSEMKRKEKNGMYKNIKQFRDDFELIIKNCRDYNPRPSGDEVLEQADQLEKRFHELIEDLSDESDSDSLLEELPSDAESSDEDLECENGKQSDNSEEDSNSEESEDNDASLDISYSCPTEDGDD